MRLIEIKESLSSHHRPEGLINLRQLHERNGWLSAFGQNRSSKLLPVGLTATRLTGPRRIVPAATKGFCKDIARFAQALMLKTALEPVRALSTNTRRIRF
jgi:hypothetical protein